MVHWSIHPSGLLVHRSTFVKCGGQTDRRLPAARLRRCALAATALTQQCAAKLRDAGRVLNDDEYAAENKDSDDDVDDDSDDDGGDDDDGEDDSEDDEDDDGGGGDGEKKVEDAFAAAMVGSRPFIHPPTQVT